MLRGPDLCVIYSSLRKGPFLRSWEKPAASLVAVAHDHLHPGVIIWEVPSPKLGLNNEHEQPMESLRPQDKQRAPATVTGGRLSVTGFLGLHPSAPGTETPSAGAFPTVGPHPDPFHKLVS